MLTRPFPFRWVLPLTQLLVCFLILLPVRGRLLFGIEEAVHSYAPTQDNNDQRVFNLPPLTVAEEKKLDAAARRAELYIRVPLVLNFPAAVVQVPYILASPAKREWVPQGMFPETWRALSWPLAGLVFWWLVGRGFEALDAARRRVVYPRLGKTETVFAAILLLIGVITLVGIVTSTPDDRKDIQFMALVAGGLLWGALGGVVVAARFRQWRITEANATAPASTA